MSERECLSVSDIKEKHHSLFGSSCHIDGDAMYDSGKLEQAFELWTKGAELGNIQCMKNVAWAYSASIGCEENKEKSREWSDRADEEGREGESKEKKERESRSIKRIDGLDRELIRQQDCRRNAKAYPNENIVITDSDIVLLTQYYIDDCPMREAENDLAMKRNLDNPAIKKIVVFLEDDIRLPFVTDKVEYVFINDHMTYGDGFEYMRGKPGVKILANSDMYFEQDITELAQANFTNRIFCWSRHDLEPDGVVVPPKPCRSVYTGRKVPINEADSSDAFVWRDVSNFKSNFYLGVSGCDVMVLASAEDNGMEVVNIGKLFNAIHIHWSEKRPHVNCEGQTFYSREELRGFPIATSRSEIGL